MSPREAPGRDVPAGGGVRIRLGAVPVRLERAVFIQLAVLAVVTAVVVRQSGHGSAALQALVVCVVVLVTFAVHEAGHVLAARRLGLAVHAVVVRGVLDGATQRLPSPDPRVSALVSLSGPLASAGLAALGLAAALLTPDPLAAGRLTVATNSFVLLSTLTAGPRSDGVRALRAWRQARGG